MLRIGIPFAFVLALSTPAFAQAQISDAARQHFQAGVALLQDPDGARYEEAYREFKAAYAASPSWKILGNLGICAMKLERDGEAIEALQKYLGEGGAEIDQAEREQFERDLQTLKVGSGGVTLYGLTAGDIVIDRRVPLSGSPVANRYDPATPLVLRMRAGRHEVTVQRAGHAEASFPFDVSSGGNVEHTFEFTKSEAKPAPGAPGTLPSGEPPTTDGGSGVSGRKIGAYTAFGVGAVGAALGVIFTVQRSSKSSDAEKLYDACLDEGGCNQSDAAEIQALDDDAASAGTLGLVGFAVGAAGLGTGLVLLLTGSDEKSARNEPHVTPFVGVGRVGLTGTF